MAEPRLLWGGSLGTLDALGASVVPGEIRASSAGELLGVSCTRSGKASVCVVGMYICIYIYRVLDRLGQQRPLLLRPQCSSTHLLVG